MNENIYKRLFFLTIVIILIAAVGSISYKVGLNTNKVNEKYVQIQKLDEPAPVITSQPQNTIGPTKYELNEDTISYAKVQNKFVLRYRNKVYDDANQLNMEPKDISNFADLDWRGMIDCPSDVLKNEFMFDEVFGLMPISEKSFLFIMRWGKKTGLDKDQVNISYYLYRYNEEENNLKLLKKFNEDYSSGSYQIPKLDSVDPSGKYLSLKMFGCWNCGGHPPETLLINLVNLESQNIGRTSYFKWSLNGKYEYKDNKEIECVGDVMGPCFESPENLPMKSGEFTY